MYNDNIDITEELEEKGLEILRLTKDYLMDIEQLNAEISGVMELDNGVEIKQTVTIEFEEV